MHLMSAGDHVVSMDDVYGGTRRLFEKVWKKHGVDFTFADLSQPDALERSITDRTRLVWIESPTNPMLKLVDIAATAKACHERGVRLVVDNTFMTPYFQRPLELGADLVVHSTTKYLNGHSDVVGGVLVTSDDDLREQLAFVQNSAGAVPGPMDSFMVLRGLKTLHVRMDRHQSNAMALATWLSAHPRAWTRSCTRGCPPIRSTSLPSGRCPGSAGWSRCGYVATSGRWPRRSLPVESSRLPSRSGASRA